MIACRVSKPKLSAHGNCLTAHDAALKVMRWPAVSVEFESK
jgi:hypothetical protein